MSMRIILCFIFVLMIFQLNARDCPQRDELVTSLPDSGTVDPADFPCMYTGFISIDKEVNSQMFYWLFLKKDNFKTAPLVLWLNGGPGSSSMIGLFTENGPLRILEQGGIRIDDLNSWTRIANVIYIDQPVGTGFSFIQNLGKFPENEERVKTDMLIFLKAFFISYPDLQKVDFYITGESYGGKYIPNIAKAILDSNIKDVNVAQKINLKRILIGNGLYDAKVQRGMRRDLALGLNMMSEYDDAPQYDNKVYQCYNAIANNNKILAPDFCGDIEDFVIDIAGDVNRYDIRKPRSYDDTFDKALEIYLNRDDVLTAIHVKEKTIKPVGKAFVLSNELVQQSMQDDINFDQTVSILDDLLANYNFPIYLYAGQYDFKDGPQGLEKIIRSLNYVNQVEFQYVTRQLWKTVKQNENQDNKEFDNPGYVKLYGNLAVITVKDAGHLVPGDQLGYTLDMLSRAFLTGNNWACPTGAICDLTKIKCDIVNNCNKSGKCDITTGNKCICNADFYGPDCSFKAFQAIDNSNILINPKTLNLFKFDVLDKDVKFDIEAQNLDLTVFLLKKSLHEFIFDLSKADVVNKAIKGNISIYIKKENLKDYLLIISNNDIAQTNNFKILITDPNSK